MNESAVTTPAAFTLPPTVVSKVDVSRLVRELERIDNELTTITVRAKAGVQQQPQITMSDQLNAFLTQNKLSLTENNARTDLIKQIRVMKDSVPIIHMTFAVEADRESLQYLAGWLRAYIHPQAVIDVGLQPALIAGVYLRTSNQIKDLSLRGMLKGSHDLLVKDLDALREVPSGSSR